MNFKEELIKKIKENKKHDKNKIKKSSSCGWLLKDVVLGEMIIKDVFVVGDELDTNIDIVAISFLYRLFVYYETSLRHCQNFEHSFKYIKESLIYCEHYNRIGCILKINGEEKDIRSQIISLEEPLYNDVYRQIETLDSYFKRLEAKRSKNKR